MWNSGRDWCLPRLGIGRPEVGQKRDHEIATIRSGAVGWVKWPPPEGLLVKLCPTSCAVAKGPVPKMTNDAPWALRQITRSTERGWARSDGQGVRAGA
jgi:hypothetical protein